MSRRWHSARRTSEPDRWLEERGLYRKHMPRDASCLFRAVSENLFHTQRYFPHVRAACVHFIAANPLAFQVSLNCPLESYVKEMSNPSEYGGFRELEALSHVYRRDFVVLEVNKNSQSKVSNGYSKEIYLFYVPETKHFDAIYTKDHIANSAFCQSIVYELLFDGVFQMKDLFYAVEKMLHDKVSTDHVEYFMSENVERRRRLRELKSGCDDDEDGASHPFPKCRHQEPGACRDKYDSILVVNKGLNRYEDVCLACLDVDSARELLQHGITPFPYKVAKALDPSIYRNIEFDVWSEMRKEVRYGLRYADGSTLQVGVKCLCRLEPEQPPYYCHIQEMQPEAGTTVVFVEEVGVKAQLRLDQLEPLPKEEARPWAPPYRQARAHSHLWNVGLMLQQLSNIARKHTTKTRKSKGACEEEKRVESRADECEKECAAGGDCADWCAPCRLDLVMCAQCAFPHPPPLDLSAYHRLDYYNFQPYPVEVTALPLMVDCRPLAGAPPPATSSPPAPADQPLPQHTTPQGPGGDVAGGPPAPSPHAAAPPAARVSTPAAAPPLNTYSGVGGGYGPLAPYGVYGGAGAAGAGAKAGAGVVLCAPPPLAPLPPPPNINTAVHKSVQPNGSDLPMNDMPTLRYFFNLGVELLWSNMYAPPLLPPHHAPPPPLPPPPPRYYSPVHDLAQDMQQGMSLHERGPPAHNGEHKTNGNKAGGGAGAAGGGGDKLLPAQNKGNGQRPPLGPRFNRGNGEGNHGNHQNNKNYNKGRLNNSRRNSHADGAGAAGARGGYAPDAECEPPVYSVPYVQYAPPIYHYYPVESDPGMMSMMGGMGYMGYVGEELAEHYPPAPLLPPYYPPYPHPPHPPHQPHQPHPHDHK